MNVSSSTSVSTTVSSSTIVSSVASPLVPSVASPVSTAIDYKIETTSSSERPLRILLIGDQHIKPSNIQIFEIFLEKMRELLVFLEISGRKIDFIVFLGDALHSFDKIYIPALTMLSNILAELKKDYFVFLLVGNHERVCNSIFLEPVHALVPFKEWSNLKVIDTVFSFQYLGKQIVFVPYVPDGRFIEALESTIGESWKTADCILAHQLVDGCQMGSIIADKVEEWKPYYPLLISGHIHKKQHLAKNLYYTGSLIQENFGEEADKTIGFLSLHSKSPLRVLPFQSLVAHTPTTEKYLEFTTSAEEKEATCCYEIDLGLPKKYSYTTTFESLQEWYNGFCQYQNSRVKTNDEYKLTIQGNGDNLKMFRSSPCYKDLLLRKVKISYDVNKQQSSTVSSDLFVERKHISFSSILESLLQKYRDSKAIMETYKELSKS